MHKWAAELGVRSGARSRGEPGEGHRPAGGPVDRPPLRRNLPGRPEAGRAPARTDRCTGGIDAGWRSWPSTATTRGAASRGPGTERARAARLRRRARQPDPHADDVPDAAGGGPRDARRSGHRLAPLPDPPDLSTPRPRSGSAPPSTVTSATIPTACRSSCQWDLRHFVQQGFEGKSPRPRDILRNAEVAGGELAGRTPR